MTDFRTFKSGEILSNDERAKLSPEDRKRYDVEARIRRAMALANDTSASENERAQATKLVSKLITRYQIDMEALMEKRDAKGPIKIVEFDFELSNRYNIGAQRALALQMSVVTPLGGKMVYTDSRSAKYPVVCNIFLPEDVVDFAKTLMASLMLQVETGMKVASVQHQRELKEQWVAPKHQASMMLKFRRGYLQAWGATVGRRMAQGREEARQEASAESGKEIVLRDTASLANAALEAKYPKTRKARAVLVSDTGRTAGIKDGRRAQIGKKSLVG